MAGTKWLPFLPEDIIKNRFQKDNRSIKVSIESGSAVEAQTTSDKAFNEGRGYRLNYPFTIPNGGSDIVLKFVVEAPIDLTFSQTEIDQGGILYRVFTSAQVTETAPVNTPVDWVYPKNPRVPHSGSAITVTTGGTVTTTGDENTTLRIRTASGAGNRSNAVSGESSKRGFPATTAYVIISQLNGVNTDTTGVLKLEWEVVE